MSIVTFHIPDATERKLRDRAGELGQTLEAYLQQLAERVAGNGSAAGAAEGDGRLKPAVDETDGFPKYVSRPRPTADEVVQLLDEFSAGPLGKVLPPDFSRADIYDDHD